MAAASGPAPTPSAKGFEIPEPVIGKPIRLSWKASPSRPSHAVWLDRSLIPKVVRIRKNRKTTLIKREGLGSLPTKLLVIPKNRYMRPEVIEIARNARKAAFNSSRIPEDEIWLWGTTPESPCSMSARKTPLGISVRMLDNKSRFHSFAGAFLWKIKAANTGAAVTAFYFDDYLNALKTAKIPGISKAGKRWQFNCDRHHGVTCKFVFETDGDDWGKTHRVSFNAEKPPIGCPV